MITDISYYAFSYTCVWTSSKVIVNLVLSLNKMPAEEVNNVLNVTEEDVALTRKALGLTERGIQDDIDSVLEWFNKQPHLVNAGISREFIERMLIINKGSREKTKQRIDNYYKYRAYAPDLVQDRHIQIANHSKEPWSFFIQTLIPKLYEGKRITITKYTDPNANNFFLDDLFRSSLMFSDIRLTKDYMLGDIWIIDFKPLGFSHILRMNPVILQKTANIFQEGIGMKVNEIYVLNAMAIFEPVLNVLKNFLKPKILDRIIITNTLEDLHKCIPKEYLPKDYGGSLPSMEEFKEANVKALSTKEMKDYLSENSKKISYEKLRPGYDANEDSLAGSFKKLDFD